MDVNSVQSLVTIWLEKGEVFANQLSKSFANIILRLRPGLQINNFRINNFEDSQNPQKCHKFCPSKILATRWVYEYLPS